MITDVDATNYSREVLEAEGSVIVQFHAEWCGPCKALSPHFQSAAAEFATGSPRFVRADIDQLDRQTLVDLGIMSVPRIIEFKDGAVVRELKGRTKYSILEELETSG